MDPLVETLKPFTDELKKMELLIDAIRAFPAEARQGAVEWALMQVVERERRDDLLLEVGRLTNDELERLLRTNGVGSDEPPEPPT